MSTTVGAFGAVAPLLAPAQAPTTISGRVTSETGAPAPGVQVFVPELSLGAVTTAEGTYSFTVPAARVHGQPVTLTARAIGFRPKNAHLVLNSTRIVQDFVLETTAQQLTEVVVTGAGTVTTAEKLGNKIDQVRSDEIVRSNEPNFVEALAAKAPNLQVQSQSGDPGASVSIQIRGIKTMTGTGQPLFVVDGIPLDNSTINIGANNADVVAPNRASDLNPDDIESVSILKGAAAAAIYGSRAAQGVILVTTKSGKAGPTKYSLRSSFSFDDVNKGYDLQRSYAQGSGGESGTCSRPDCRAGRFSWGPKLAAGTKTYDHFGELFTTGHIADNTLSISGGDDRRTFYLSAGRLDHQGVVIGTNDDYARNTIRLKATQRITPRLNLGGNISYVDTRGSFIQRGNNVSGIMLGSLRTPPEFDNKQYLSPTSGLHRSYRFPNPSPASFNVGRGFDNPMFVIFREPATSDLGRAFGNIDVEYQPLTWLRLKETAGADYANDERSEALPLTSSNHPTGQLNRANFVNYTLDHNFLATATTNLTSRIAAELTLGQNLNSTAFRQVYVTGYDYIAPEPFKLTNTITYNPSDNETLVHTESYFGQATIDLYDQLHFTGAARNDGSSAFAQNNRRHWYPKASAAWTFTEALGDLGGKLDYGKVRLAYGVTGKAPDPYSTLFGFGTGYYYEYGGAYLKTIYRNQGGIVSPALIGNDSLRPERTREAEYGLDLGMFRGFSDLSVTYYDGRTTDVIFPIAAAASTGHTQQVRNVGTITNKGLEVTWNFHPLHNTRRADWDLGLMWSRNRNRLVSLKGASEVVVGSGNFGQSVAKPGNPVGAIEEFDFARCRYHEASNVVSGVDINAWCHAHSAPDGALYIDDGTIGTAGFPTLDYTPRIVGSAEPKWQGSVRNTFTLFGKWQLSGLLDIRKGGRAWDGTRGALYAYGTHKDTEIRGQQFVFGPSKNGAKGFYTNNVTGPGVGTVVTIDQDWFQGDGGAFGDQGAQFVEDAGFVKLREISIAYTLDQKFLRSALGLSSVDLRLSGRNLKTWTNYKGIDPENNLAGAAGFIQGFDWFNNPQTRSIVLSVGLNR